MNKTEKVLEVLKNQDDWIGRFLGFLSSFAYMRQEYPVEAPRGCHVKDNTQPGDNILHICGIPGDGKTAYKDALVRAMSKKSEYTCVQVSFDQCAVGMTDAAFQVWLKDRFAAADGKMRFPFLKLLTTYEENDLSTLGELFDGYLSSLNDIFTGSLVQKVTGAKKLVESVVGTKDYIADAMNAHITRFTAELEDLRARKAQDPNDTLYDDKDIYKFLCFDLCYNAQKALTHPKEPKRYICFVDKYELARVCLDEERQQQPTRLLEMMGSVSDVVWVLFSSENPDKRVRALVPRKNCWRISGLSREEAYAYLKSKLPGQDKRWYKGVYRYTGGYIELMDICIKAQQEPSHQFDLPPRPAPDPTRSRAELMPEYERTVEWELEGWFSSVWNDGPWEDDLREDDQRDNPIAFLMREAFRYVEEGSHEATKRNLIPCLCYLAQKSLQALGTVRQYSWERGAMNVTELNDAGRACLCEIEGYTPFCVEYVEHPGVLYLDPVIVRILTKHAAFDTWVAQFVKECVVDSQVSDNAEQVESRGPGNVLEESAPGMGEQMEARLMGLEETMKRLLTAQLMAHSGATKVDGSLLAGLLPVAAPTPEEQKKSSENRKVLPNYFPDDGGKVGGYSDDVDWTENLYTDVCYDDGKGDRPDDP